MKKKIEQERMKRVESSGEFEFKKKKEGKREREREEIPIDHRFCLV